MSKATVGLYIGQGSYSINELEPHHSTWIFTSLAGIDDEPKIEIEPVGIKLQLKPLGIHHKTLAEHIKPKMYLVILIRSQGECLGNGYDLSPIEGNPPASMSFDDSWHEEETYDAKT